MKVAINLLQLQPGRVEGVVTYVKQLIANLPNYSGDGEIVIIKQPDLDIGTVDDRIRVISLGAPSLVERVMNKLMAVSHIHTSSRALRRLTALLKKHDVDIVHYPFSTLPPSDFKLKCSIVLSVMDIQHEFLPEVFSAAELANRRAAFKPSAERADAIISISQFTADSIIEKFGLGANKITVIPLAGDMSKHPAVPDALPKEFMFYPAGDWKHKNHSRLLKALAELKKAGFDGKLVLTGLRTDRAKSLHAEMSSLGLADDVVDLGQVSYDEVSGIYSKAKMLVFPSLFEGFGIPPIEAMAAGVPVVCSNTTSLPEIVGEAAETFDPESMQEILVAIQKVWGGAERRAELIQAGKQQAKKFSWAITANQTYNVYKEVYEQTSK